MVNIDYFDVPALFLWANVTLADFGCHVMPFVLYLPKIVKMFGFPFFRIWSVADEGCDKDASCALNLIFTFIFITV